jgi:glycerate kinase
VRSAIGGCCTIGYIVYWGCHKVKIVHQQRRGKDNLQLHGAALECVECACGLQINGFLHGSLGKDYEKIYECGIQSLLTTVDGCIPLSEAMERAEELYYRGAVRLFRFFL